VSQEVLDAIRKRRTIRHYTDEDVSEEQVETLLEMAMVAPNRLNRQPWHFFVIRDRELQDELADVLARHPYLESAPVVVAVGARPELSSTWQMDVMAAIENMLIAAAAMGLGTAVLANPDGTVWQAGEEMLTEALRIPLQRGVRIPALVTVGYPAEQPPPHGREDRFDQTKVHYGRWGERELQSETAPPAGLDLESEGEGS
jgi:nitroreductase